LMPGARQRTMRHAVGRALLRRTLLVVVALVAQVVTTHAYGGLV